MIVTRGLGPGVTLVTSGLGPGGLFEVVEEVLAAFSITLATVFPAMAARFDLLTPFVCDVARALTPSEGTTKIMVASEGDPVVCAPSADDVKVQPKAVGKPRVL